MASFNIYKNPSGSVEAVKQGWSWPAFFLTWIWAFSKGLNNIGVSLLIASAGVILAVYGIGDPQRDYAVFWIFAILSAIWSGNKGNELLEQNLRDKGYKKLKSVLAETPEGAVAALTNQFLEENRVKQDNNDVNEKYCKDCSSPNASNAKYCSNCGVKFE
jgi:hypothetical protein